MPHPPCCALFLASQHLVSPKNVLHGPYLAPEFGWVVSIKCDVIGKESQIDVSTVVKKSILELFGASQLQKL